MTPGTLVAILGVSVVATLVVLDRVGWMVGPGSTGFLIRSRPKGSVEVRGRVPKGKLPELKEFCARNLASDRPYTIRGTWGGGKTLTLRFTGGLSPAQRQRARNFLIQCLD